MEKKPDIRALIFDLGGVILRTEDYRPREAMAEQFGMTRMELENIFFNNPVALKAERGLAAREEAWAWVAQSLNLPVEEMPAFHKQFFSGDRVDFKLVDLIQSLRSRYRTALLSNTWEVDLPRFLREDLQIPDTFDVVISSAKMRISKPDPEIFRQALELVDAHPEEAIFVDDNLDNVTAASTLGIHTIRFFNTDQLYSDLQMFINLPTQKMG
ncbi:MAG: HAD family phosphatase [Chloroflexi bacterium]|nr:HAD family phosphatase [Chloroflexota bacterium]